MDTQRKYRPFGKVLHGGVWYWNVAYVTVKASSTVDFPAVGRVSRNNLTGYRCTRNGC